MYFLKYKKIIATKYIILEIITIIITIIQDYFHFLYNFYDIKKNFKFQIL